MYTSAPDNHIKEYQRTKRKENEAVNFKKWNVDESICIWVHLLCIRYCIFILLGRLVPKYVLFESPYTSPASTGWATAMEKEEEEEEEEEKEKVLGA